MKTKSFLVFLSLFMSFSFNVGAQNDTIRVYGFSGSGNTNFLTVSAIDALSGAITREYQLNDYNAYALGSSTYDQIKKEYIFIGVDQNQAFRIPSLNIPSGNIFTEPLLTETVNDFQYDMNSTNLYGLGNYISDTIEIAPGMYDFVYATRFLDINKETGTITPLNPLPELNSFVAGGSTFDANGARYIVNGYDQEFVRRLFIINAENGEIISSNPLNLGNNEYLNELEYNNIDNKLYGLYRNLNTLTFEIVSVDLTDNQLTTVFSLEDLQYFVQGGSVFHQETQSFILYYIDNSNQSRLMVIDVLGQVMVANNPVEHFTELEVDNSHFAMTTFQTTSIDDFAFTSSSAIRAYPNPTQGEIRIHSKEPLRRIEVYTMLGELILVQELDGTENEQWIDLSNLPQASYLLSITAGSNVMVRQIAIID